MEFFLELQPLRLDIKRRLTSRSDRVKCVDLHPTEPWMLCALYNGHVHVMNYENQQLFKDFEVFVELFKFYSNEREKKKTPNLKSVFVLNVILFIQVCDLPVRCARFIARKNWVVTGSDDMQVSNQ